MASYFASAIWEPRFKRLHWTAPVEETLWVSVRLVGNRGRGFPELSIRGMSVHEHILRLVGGSMAEVRMQCL